MCAVAASTDDPFSGGAVAVVSDPVAAVDSDGDAVWPTLVVPGGTIEALMALADFLGSSSFGDGSAVNGRWIARCCQDNPCLELSPQDNRWQCMLQGAQHLVAIFTVLGEAYRKNR
jgi:hypothetical protein